MPSTVVAVYVQRGATRQKAAIFSLSESACSAWTWYDPVGDLNTIYDLESRRIVAGVSTDLHRTIQPRNDTKHVTVRCEPPNAEAARSQPSRKPNKPERLRERTVGLRTPGSPGYCSAVSIQVPLSGPLPRDCGGDPWKAKIKEEIILESEKLKCNAVMLHSFLCTRWPVADLAGLSGSEPYKYDCAGLSLVLLIENLGEVNLVAGER